MLAETNRCRIDAWVNESPDYRRIENEELENGDWRTRALEEGRIVYEETDYVTDEPMLNRTALWCERHTGIERRPPAKTS